MLSQSHSSQSTYAKASPETYRLCGFVSLPLPRPLLVLFESRIELGFSDLKWCGKNTNCRYRPSVRNRQYAPCFVRCRLPTPARFLVLGALLLRCAFLSHGNPNGRLHCRLKGHVTSLWLWMVDPGPSGRTFPRHGSVSSAHSAVILVYGLKFLEFQEIRQSLSLWAHCQTPSRLIVGAANLSAEGRQPALPHHGEDAILVKKMEMDHAALTLLCITVKPCCWLPDTGQQRQNTFSGSKCDLGLFVSI